MTKPLALIYYNQLLPGSQLANRLFELGYRVLSVTDLNELGLLAEREKPILFIVEISKQAPVCAAIAALKANPTTQHIPVLGFSVEMDKTLQAAAIKSGTSLVATGNSVLEQLPQLLDHVLEVQ